MVSMVTYIINGGGLCKIDSDLLSLQSAVENLPNSCGLLSAMQLLLGAIAERFKECKKSQKLLYLPGSHFGYQVIVLIIKEFLQVFIARIKINIVPI